jgi:hypothetical protein
MSEKTHTSALLCSSHTQIVRVRTCDVFVQWHGINQKSLYKLESCGTAN